MKKMPKLVAWGLLATLPLIASMCQGPPPEPETPAHDPWLATHP